MFKLLRLLWNVKYRRRVPNHTHTRNSALFDLLILNSHLVCLAFSFDHARSSFSPYLCRRLLLAITKSLLLTWFFSSPLPTLHSAALPSLSMTVFLPLFVSGSGLILSLWRETSLLWKKTTRNNSSRYNIHINIDILQSIAKVQLSISTA